MKTTFLLILVLLVIGGISLFLQSTHIALATTEITPTATIGNPRIVFSIGYASSSGAVYQPDNKQICKIWNDISNGYLSSIRPQGYNKSYLIVQFTSKAVMALPANNVECEEVSVYNSHDRLNWLVSHSVYKATITSQNSKAIYIDGNTLLEVTLTNTLTPTSTNTPTMTYTATPTETYSPTYTETAAGTTTRTSTVTKTPTPTVTETSTPTETMTVTSTRTSTQTSTSTRTSTPTVTPALSPDKIVPSNVSTLHLAKAGHICYGQVVGGNKNSVVEFVSDYSTGLEISGGGCFTQKYYNLNQVMRFLESRGIRYGYVSLPRPTLTPSRTLSPTITIANNLVISIGVDGVKDVLISEPGTVCWGKKVGNAEYKVVRFQKVSSTPVRVVTGGCTVGQNLSAEDVFNYLRRVRNTILLGFVEIK